MPRKKSQKKAEARPGQILVAAWFPAQLAERLEQVAKDRDLNRSQLLRRAAEAAVR